ncbi:MAG: hypothetical protein AB3N23_16000 [Paracoccaceae bacterium]
MFNPIRPLTSCAAVALIVVPPMQAAAQVPGAVYTVVVPSGQFGSNAFVGVVVSGIAAAKQFCSDLNDSAFRVDCLAERLALVASEIPADSDYADVSAVLKDTSNQLAQLARSNRDGSRGRAHATQQKTQERTTRPLTPVAPAQQAAVNQQAIAILESTETILLRSAESSKEKRNQYAKIADAVGSNKVLLRA